jgi:hypothetical protein
VLYLFTQIHNYVLAVKVNIIKLINIVRNVNQAVNHAWMNTLCYNCIDGFVLMNKHCLECPN